MPNGFPPGWPRGRAAVVDGALMNDTEKPIIFSGMAHPLHESWVQKPIAPWVQKLMAT
jgi:hypothetical protein